MRYETWTKWGQFAAIGLLAVVMAACGGNGGGGTAMTEPDPDPDPPVVMPDPDPPTCAEDPSQQRCVDAANMAKAAQEAEAAKFAPAIADPDGDGMFAGLQKDERPNLPGGTAYPDAIAGNPSGAGTPAQIKVNANDVLGVDDMKDGVSRVNQFQEMGKVAYLGNFDGQAYKGENKNKVYDLMVYTDKKDAASISYFDYYSMIDSGGTRVFTPNRLGVAATSIGDVPNFADEDHANYGRLTLQQGTGDEAKLTPKEAALFDADWFPTGAAGSATGSNSIPATATGDARKFEGTFNGVTGVYECGGTGTACTATNDKDGNLELLTGQWEFTPGKGLDITTVEIDAVGHDADYLAFGYWIETTTNRDDTTDVAVNTFATGSQPYFLAGFDITDNTDNTTGPQGKATYTGQAAGQYVLKTGPVGDAKPADSGGFTGNARLTALFGGGSIAADDHFSVSGSITHLRNGDGEMIDPNWTVSLMKADMAGGGAVETPLTIDSGDTTGGGSWEGDFFGPASTVEDFPTGVAGEFNAHFSNGHVIGAFGATKK